MGEISNKVDKALDKIMGLNGHYEPITHIFVDDNGKEFGRRESFIWVED